MHRALLHSTNSLLHKIHHIPPLPTLHFHSSTHSQHNHHHTNQSSHDTQKNELEIFPRNLMSSPSRVHKLISSQSDPLLAKEIFDLASRQPNFTHTYPTYHSLILKLGNSRQFSLMEDVLTQMKKHGFPATPGLFSRIICIYGDAHLPQKSLKMFYNIVQYNCKPTTKHLNHVISVLVAHKGFLRTALDVFRVAHKYGVEPNVKSYNILMRAFCFGDQLSVAYKLFNEMFKREVMPDVESYRILMQGLCRKSQVASAVDLLDDMLNKGFVPDTLSYTSLLNSLCRKKKLKEAYKLLCRMKVKGCNPNITHYNTVILGLCREGRAFDAIKVLNDMYDNGCMPNLESYRTLVGGLVDQGMYDEARKYVEEMISKDFTLHFSIAHRLIKGLCNVGRVEEGCDVLGELLKHGQAPYVGTWEEVVPRICEVEEMEKMLNEVRKVEITPHTKIVDAGVALEQYLIKKIQANSRNF